MEKPVKISGNLLRFDPVQISGNLLSPIKQVQISDKKPLKECWFDYENQAWVKDGVYTDVGLGIQLGDVKVGQVPADEIIAKYKPEGQRQ